MMQNTRNRVKVATYRVDHVGRQTPVFKYPLS
jgi:hypothetical protein